MSLVATRGELPLAPGAAGGLPETIYSVPEKQFASPRVSPDGTQVLVTVLSNGDDLLLRASEVSLNAIWDNPEDDVYAELLER